MKVLQKKNEVYSNNKDRNTEEKNISWKYVIKLGSSSETFLWNVKSSSEKPYFEVWLRFYRIYIKLL